MTAGAGTDVRDGTASTPEVVTVPAPASPTPTLSVAPEPVWRIAVIGAGPAGLALALHAARKLPAASITVFDARPLERDVSTDARTVALALGSVQWLEGLGVWPAARAQPIRQVHVSQAPPSLGPFGRDARVVIDAAAEGVPMLGAVIDYGTLVAALQRAWLDAEAAGGGRRRTRFGQPVSDVRTLRRSGAGGGAGADEVEVDAGIVERFDVAVVAEGGVFADQARKAVRRDYRQTAWVGRVALHGAVAGRAIERFTRDGPVALLPLARGAVGTLPQPPSGAGAPDAGGGVAHAALVWCVGSDDDPVAPLDDRQRLALLAARLPPEAGRPVAISPLKRFALGLNAERTLVDGLAVRIGNAAQTLHPVAGQGLNLGLRDAVALVDAIRRAPPGGMGAALRRVEWTRAVDRWSMIAATDALARGFTWRWPGLGALRGAGLAALDAAGPLKSAFARQMMYGRR